MWAVLFAVGIDFARCVVFEQSAVWTISRFPGLPLFVVRRSSFVLNLCSVEFEGFENGLSYGIDLGLS